VKRSVGEGYLSRMAERLPPKIFGRAAFLSSFFVFFFSFCGSVGAQLL
jgi:hypothetical protein